MRIEVVLDVDYGGPRLLLAAAALSLAACAAGASPQEPAPTVTIAPAPVAAPAPQDPPPPPPLALADATEQEKLAFLSTICRTAVLEGRAGCEKCAPGGAPDARPNGTVAVDPPQFWGLRSLTFGSFTRPGADEAAAVLWGCEAREKNYGGTVLAERTEGGWRMLRYDSGLNPASCRAYRRRDGRDVLVCSWNVEERGQVSRAEVFSYDFAVSTPEDVEKGWKGAVSTRDDSGACWDALPRVVTKGTIAGFELRDVRGEGVLFVDVTQIRARSNAGYEKRCADVREASDRHEEREVDTAAPLGKPRAYRLELGYDGEKFVPTAASRAIMKGL